MLVYEIPLIAAPQRFSVTLFGQSFRMDVLWRDAPTDYGEQWGGWTLDLADASGNPLVAGIPLVTGTDLLSPYPDIGFQGALYVLTDGDPDAVPNFSNLGSTANLYAVQP